MPLSRPPHEIMSEAEGKALISEVFWNMGKILEHHQRMLGSLLSRQRDQHPLVQSVADIILDCKPYSMTFLIPLNHRF